MRKIIGTLNGKSVVATYSRAGQSDLPSLIIRCDGRVLWSGKGSSLGPTNAECPPDDGDIAFWRSLVDGITV